MTGRTRQGLLCSDDTGLADFSNSVSDNILTVKTQDTEVTIWCKDNYLDLNMDKIWDIVVDFIKKGS